MNHALLWAALGTGFAFLMTALGASAVLLFKKEMNENIRKAFLGFAAGVMIAASVWSLLIPAIEGAVDRGGIGWIPAAGGFALGGLIMFLLDSLLPYWHPSTSFHRTTLLVSAVTLHNIPEGMAVGLAFALAAQNPGEPAYFASAFALALGIGIQNFPEGAAVSLPLRQEGVSRKNSFLLGSMSGLAEFIFGVGITFIAARIVPYMPWLLALSAGAMIYVVVEELIPEAHSDSQTMLGTAGVMLGFLVMMILDVALG